MIELLIALGILALISTIVVLIINPTQLVAQARDAQRVSDLKRIDTAIQLNRNSLDETLIGYDTLPDNIVYVSLPDTNSILTDNCGTSGEYSLPALTTGWQYRCVASLTNLRKIDGNGWIPVTFTSVSTNPLLSLPVDPVNNSNYYYAYTKSNGSATVIESNKYVNEVASIDGGTQDNYFETAPITWIGSGGGSTGIGGEHWDAVDDVVSDDDYLNYIYSFSSNEQIDYYTLQNVFVPLPDRTSMTVHVQGSGCIVSLYFRIGVNVTAAPQAGGCNDLGDGNSIRPGRVHQETIGNPNGGDWNQNDLDNLEVGIGIKMHTAGYPGAITRVWVESRAGEILKPESDISVGIEGVYYTSGDTYTGHWGKVDEPLADSVSYVWTPSITEKRDTYTLSNTLVSGTTINSVIVRMYSHGCNPRPSLKLGGTEVYDESGAGACDRPALRSNWGLHESPAMSRPGGGSWMWADLNNLQVGAGIRRDDVFGYNGEISAVYVIINYDSGSRLILRPDGDVTTNIESAVP